MIIKAGVACFNKNKILLIQKHHTNAFTRIVVGLYPSPVAALEYLNDITISEKKILMASTLLKLCKKIYGYNGNPLQHIRLMKYIRLNYNCSFVEYIKGIQTKLIEPKWEIPKGSVDKGEKIKDAALRELKEETGIMTLKKHRKKICYQPHENIQIYYYKMFLKHKKNPNPKDNKEISKAAWISLTDLTNYVTDETQYIIETIWNH